MKKLLLALVGVVGFAGVVIGQQTKLLTADKHNEYGLVYMLPTTSLEIEVTARHTVSKPGPYYQYAKKYVGTDKVVQKEIEKWEILSVNVRPYGTPNSSQKYLMQLKSGATTYICVDDNGMLLSINKEVPAVLPISEVEPQVGMKPRDINEFLKYVNEDFIASQSSARKAQMLAENMMEVRESKVALSRGTSENLPKDGKQLELMLNSLASQEAALTAAFTGLTDTETVTRTFTYTPGLEGKSVLFRLSDFGGFVDSEDYSGEPVYLNVDVLQRGKLPVNDKGEEKKLPKDAVMYTIPGSAKVSVTMLGKTLWSGDIDMAQYGVQFGLDPKLFSDKKNRSFATFNAITGGVTEIGTDGSGK